MSLRSLITRHLEDAAGAYMPNHFLLWLDEDTPFITPDGDIDQDHLHVFVHEYWHYWHNISTLAGFKQFAFTQHVLVHFAETLLGAADGTSEGSATLDPTAQQDLETLFVLHDDLDGQVAPDDALLDDWDVDFTVDGITEIPEDETYQGRTAPNPLVEVTVTLSWPDGTADQAEFLLGSATIEESVAYLVEEQVRQKLTGAAHSPPPVFPYGVLPRVLAHIFGHAVDDRTAAALGTLALLATHPGPALVALAKRMKADLDRGTDLTTALDNAVVFQRQAMVGPLDAVLSADLPELQDIHQGRGLMEGALRHIGGQMASLLRRRLHEPLFDVALVFDNLSAESLMAFHASYPPCDLLQERSGDEDDLERDELYSFDPTPEDADGHRPTDFTRSLQAQQHFVLSHVDSAGTGFDDSASADNAKCPFYGACDLPLRRSQPSTCKEQPWLSFNGPGDSCWYSNGVAGTLGKVTIRKRPGSEVREP